MQFIIHFSNCSGLNPAMRKKTKRHKMFAILVAIILSATAFQLTTAEALAQTPASIIYTTINPDATRMHTGRRAVQSSNGNVHVVLFDISMSGTRQVFHIDKYSSWTQTMIWTFAADQTYPSIAIDSYDDLHVVWAMRPDGDIATDIYYSYSTDGGVSWISPINISGTFGVGSHSPVIDSDGQNRIHVAWQEENPDGISIYYSWSPIPASAIFFAPSVNITGPPPIQESEAPSIANTIDYSSGTIHIAWAVHDDIGWYIGYRNSTDAGASWLPPVSQPPLNVMGGYTASGWRPYPCISVGPDDNPHIVFHDTPAAQPYGIYHVTSSSQGASFSSPTLITTVSGGEFWPAPSISNYTSNKLNVVWHDQQMIFHAASADDGVSWATQGPIGWGMFDEYANLVHKQILSDTCDYVWTHNSNQVSYQRKKFPGWGKSIDITVDLSPYYDWGAISSYAGLSPAGNMGIYSPTHVTNFYFPSDSLAPLNPATTPRAWLVPGTGLGTYYGPGIMNIPSNPLVAVPDRNSQPCSLYVRIPAAAIIDEAIDSNVIQISSGESKTIPINRVVETMVFLANCDGAAYLGPDQPLEVQLNYGDGTKDTIVFDSIHPAERTNNIYYGPYTTFGNEILGCGPAYYDLPTPYHDDAHSEFWHWYTVYPDTPKTLSSTTFTGIQMLEYSEIYISAISYTGYMLSLDPVGYWRFNEGSGSTAYDETANNNDGTIRGASWLRANGCLCDDALEFHGGGQFFDGDRVRVPHSTSLDITGPFTIAAWINASGSDTYLAIVDKYVGGPTINSCGFTLYLSNGLLRLNIYSGSNGSQGCTGSSDLRDDDCHHVAASWDGSRIRVYVDGQKEGEAVWAIPPASTTNDLGIGERINGWGGYMPFLGTIDEVLIYNRALSQTEIDSLACSCIPGDANNDCDVNVADAVYIINFVFKSGPAPIPYAVCSGDANCDCQCNVGDAVYVISYVFKGGPAPCTCPQWVAMCGRPIYK